MDIAWFGNGTFMLIELSPLLPCTGSALFHWQRDAELLRNGPYTLRLKNASDVHPQMNELILCNWTSRWPLLDANTIVPTPSFTKTLHDAHTTSFGSIIETIPKAFSSLFSAIFQPQRQLLFVYGTLKRGFQWSAKYMAERLGCTFICEAVTLKVNLQSSCSSIAFNHALTSKMLQPMALVLGESGVPYLLMPNEERAEAQSHCIVGELWQVSSEALQGLDEYEGVSKGYYSRVAVPICCKGLFGGLKECLADVYVLLNASDELTSRPRIKEYTLDMHHRFYNAIVHVQRKQLAYLGWSASTWGKLPEREVTAHGASTSS
jgi:gamma-glutamylcyclotransferase (GGCT)/AIG2-like uncharacterized protein YtfP